MKPSALVIFKEDLTEKEIKKLHSFKNISVVISPKQLQESLIPLGFDWMSLDSFIEPGSIYEASAFAKELAKLKFPDGERIAKSFNYNGYELWWARYNLYFLMYCVPYTQYKRLLGYLAEFKKVYLYEPKFRSLFTRYLIAHERDFEVIRGPGLKNPSFISLGIIFQILLTLLSLPILMVKRPSILVFTSDFFEASQDYDFRMKFIYEELRKRKLPFVELIRSLESWKTVVKNALIRKRPVIYYEAVLYIGKLLSIVTGGRRRAKNKFGPGAYSSVKDPEEKFRLMIATRHLLDIYDDVWAIRIMRATLYFIGVHAAPFTAMVERNFHAVLACKSNSIPTVGIMHGVHFEHYVQFDFLPGYDGEKSLTIDKYGLWSKWWMEYYLKHSDAYRPEQLFISGVMRPGEVIKVSDRSTKKTQNGPIKILFISEQLAVPKEVSPYLDALLLLPKEDFSLAFRFRPFRDDFRNWLEKHRPEIFTSDNIKITQAGLQDAIGESDVVVGSHSTAVLEAVFQNRVPLLFMTQKWGDYFEIQNYSVSNPFFAQNPDELIVKIKNAQSVPTGFLSDLRERYFGDINMNGSKWVIDEIENSLKVARK